ncbi:MAG: MG2 domain-containing protein, partial [Patescibacteria group bacterium]
LYGKVLSYSANEPVQIDVIKSDTLDKVNVSLYKSNKDKLLEYLIYTKQKDSNGKEIEYGQKFINTSIAHHEKTKINTSTSEKKQEKKKYSLEPGIYYIEANYDDAVVGSSYIIVNSIGMIARQDDKNLYLSSFDLRNNQGEPVSGNLSFYDLNNSPTLIGTQSYDGTDGTYPFSLKNNLDVIIGTINNETVFIPFKLPLSQAEILAKDLDSTYKIFIFTDRPIYQPNDTVRFSGIVRVDSDSQYKVAPNIPIRIRMGYDLQPKINMIVTSNSAGAFSGEFTIPDKTTDTQFLYASANTTDQASYSDSYAYFDVLSYIKPKFELKTSTNKAEILRNEKVTFNIKGNYFNTEPLKNEEVSYKLYSQNFYEVEKAVYNSNFNFNGFGGMCGGALGAFNEYFGEQIGDEKKVTLNENGEASLEFELPKKLLNSQKITLVAEKKDQSNTIVSATNVIIHNSNFNIFFTPSAQSYKENDEIVAPFYVEDLSGNRVTNKEFTYKFLKTTYKENSTKEEAFNIGTVETDENGIGIVKMKVPENTANQSNYLSIETIDPNNITVQTRKYIYVQDTKQENNRWQGDSSARTYLRIVSKKNSYLVGDTVTLSINSPKEISAFVTLERGRVYHPQIIQFQKGENKLDIKVDSELSPSITVVFSFFAEGSYHTEGLSLNVPAMHKLLNVSLTANKSVYNPDENASLRIVTKDASGDPISANLTLSVIDKSIFGLRKNATVPIHSSLYYFRPRTTNATSSLTSVGFYQLGGKGGGGGGGANPGKTIDTLYWNPNITTDSNGETSVDVPLKGIEATWKAMVIGATNNTDVGQADVEFVAKKEVLGITDKKKKSIR